MRKISFRIEDDLLEEVDYLVDYITVRNRSQAIKLLLKKSLSKEKIAVILAKGTDLKNHNLENNLKVDSKGYHSTLKLGNTTLIQEQMRLLKKYGFNIIYILTINKVLKQIQEIFGNRKDINLNYLGISDSTKTAQALRLLREKIHSDFLVIYDDIIFEINLNEIYKQHIKSNAVCTMITTSSKSPAIKGSIKIEGNKITSFTEKVKVKENFIVSEPIYMFNPKVFEIKGESLPYDIFPKLAKKGLLEGHLSSSEVLHLHKKEDKKKIQLFIEKTV